MLAIDSSTEAIDVLSRRVDARVTAFNAQKLATWHLSVRIGAVVREAKSDQSLQALLNRADELMYERKRPRKLARD